MSLILKTAFLSHEIVMEESQKQNVYTLKGTHCLPRKFIAAIFREKNYCPIMSSSRNDGDIQFTLVPFKKPAKFDEIRDTKNLSHKELWNLVEKTRYRALPDESPFVYAGKKLFNTCRDAKLEMAKSCTRHSSLVLEYGYDAPKEGFAYGLGCGMGSNSLLMLRRGWKVMAVDILPEVLEDFKKSIPDKFTKQIKIVNQDITSCELSSESADLVIGVDVLPYIPPSKLQNLLKKIHRALKARGTFIGTLFFSKKNTPSTAFLGMVGGHHYPDFSVAPAMLKHSGFRIEECAIRIDRGGDDQSCIEFRATKLS